MRGNKKIVDKTKILIYVLAIFLSVSIVLLTGTLTYSWMVANKKVEGRGVIGNVSIGSKDIPLDTSGKIMPGRAIIQENQFLSYTGAPAYYRIRINLEFYNNYSAGVYSGKVNLPHVSIDDKFGKMDGDGNIFITKVGETIDMPTNLTQKEANLKVKITLNVTAIQQANLPNNISTAEAAFDWYEPIQNFNSMEIPETITLPNESSPVAIKKELGTGDNAGKFRIVKDSTANSSKTVSSTKTVTPTGSQEFAFFSNIAITDSNAQSVDLTNFKRYDLGIWYDLPQTKIDINTIYLTPNYTSGVMSNKSIQIAIIKNGTSAISANAFKDCSNLKVVIIPDSVTQVEASSFSNCGKLIPTYIDHKDSGKYDIKYIGSNKNRGLFLFDAEIEGKCFVDETCVAIGDFAFSNTRITQIDSKVLDSGRNPAWLRNGGLGRYVFYNSSVATFPDDQTRKIFLSIRGERTQYEIKTPVEIKNGMIITPMSFTTLGTDFFENVVGNIDEVKTFVMHDKVSSIMNEFFDNFPNLVNIEMNRPNAYFEAYNGVLYVKENERDMKLFHLPKKHMVNKPDGRFEIRNGVTGILDGAIKNVENLKYLRIPETLIQIEDGGIEGIGNCILEFVHYSDVNDFTLNINGNVLYSLDYIAHMLQNAKITFGTNGNIYPLLDVTVWASNGGKFSEENIKRGQLIVPDFVTTLNKNMIERVAAISSIKIGANVVSIASDTFNVCLNLEAIEVDAKNSHYRSYDGVLYKVVDGSKLELVKYPPENTNRAYTVEENTCRINDGAFSGAINLTSITIPDSVTSIGSHAFYECSSLTSITIKATTPPILEDYSIPDNVETIYVPAGSLDAYKNAKTNNTNGWGQFTGTFV